MMIAVIIASIGCMVFLWFLKYMQNRYDKNLEMKRQKYYEARNMVRYWERYDPGEYWPHLKVDTQTEADAIDHLIDEEEGPITIIDLGDGNGLGPDGDIYKIIQKKE